MRASYCRTEIRNELGISLSEPYMAGAFAAPAKNHPFGASGHKHHNLSVHQQPTASTIITSQIKTKSSTIKLETTRLDQLHRLHLRSYTHPYRCRKSSTIALKLHYNYRSIKLNIMKQHRPGSTTIRQLYRPNHLFSLPGSIPSTYSSRLITVGVVYTPELHSFRPQGDEAPAFAPEISWLTKIIYVR